jgi:cysteine dioxygenase
MFYKTLEELEAAVSGLFSKGVALDQLGPVLSRYRGQDWRERVSFDGDRYQRVVLFSRESYDIYLLCWLKGQASPIHDHPDNGCLLRVMEGQLDEQQFRVEPGDGLSPLGGGRLAAGDLSYLERQSVVHRIEALTDTVSLHIYSPPNYRSNHYRTDS